MNENIEFLQAFLKNPLKVGSIAPSSPELAQKMLDEIRPDEKNSLSFHQLVALATEKCPNAP